MKTVVFTVSPQNQLGSNIAFIMRLSTTPFYWGVYGTVRCLWTPCSAQ